MGRREEEALQERNGIKAFVFHFTFVELEGGKGREGKGRAGDEVGPKDVLHTDALS